MIGIRILKKMSLTRIFYRWRIGNSFQLFKKGSGWIGKYNLIVRFRHNRIIRFLRSRCIGWRGRRVKFDTMRNLEIKGTDAYVFEQISVDITWEQLEREKLLSLSLSQFSYYSLAIRINPNQFPFSYHGCLFIRISPMNTYLSFKFTPSTFRYFVRCSREFPNRLRKGRMQMKDRFLYAK